MKIKIIIGHGDKYHSLYYICPFCNIKYYKAYDNTNGFFRRICYHLKRHFESINRVGDFDNDKIKTTIKEIVDALWRRGKYTKIPCVKTDSFYYSINEDKMSNQIGKKEEIRLLKQYRTEIQSMINKNITDEMIPKMKEFKELKVIHKALTSKKVIR